MEVPYIVLFTFVAILCAIGLILLIMFLFAYRTFITLLKRQKKTVDIKKYPYSEQFGEGYLDYTKRVEEAKSIFNTIEKEEIFIHNNKGLKLQGFYFKSNIDTDTTIICSHAHRSNCFNDFALIFKFLHNRYNVLFTVSRAHLGSDGKFSSLGNFESEDLIKWAAYLEDRGHNHIFFYGISAGASNAMMSANKENIPISVKGIIEDSGFSRAYDFLVYQIRRAYSLSPYPTAPLTNFLAKLIVKTDLKKDNCINSLSESSLPVLFIHGKDDLFVPTYMAQACYNATTSPKKLLLVEKGMHFQNYYINPEIYEDYFKEFVEKHSTQTLLLRF